MFCLKREKKAKKVQPVINLVVEQESESILSNTYRMLMNNLQYSLSRKSIKTIVITSSEAQEGKSIIAGNLAITFSNDEKKVILVDCDLRKPSIHQIFNLSNSSGLSDVITNKVDIKEAIQNYNENLDVLTSGKLISNPSKALSSITIKLLFEQLKEQYDIIILDSPSIHTATDTQIISANADGTLLVIRANTTKRKSVVEAKNILAKVGANVIGAILNGTGDIK